MLKSGCIIIIFPCECLLSHRPFCLGSDLKHGINCDKRRPNDNVGEAWIWIISRWLRYRGCIASQPPRRWCHCVFLSLPIAWLVGSKNYITSQTENHFIRIPPKRPMNHLGKHLTKYPPKPWGLQQWCRPVSVTLISIAFAKVTKWGIDSFSRPQMPLIFAIALLLCAMTFSLTANRTVLVGLASTDMLALCLCWAIFPAYAAWTLILPAGVVVWLMSYFGCIEQVTFYS